MLADPLSIPIDFVIEDDEATGEPIVLSRIDSPGPLTVRKIAASEFPAGGSVAEKLKLAGLKTSLGSTESGKGLGKTTRTVIRHDATPVEEDGTVSNIAVYTVIVAPTEIQRRPKASEILLGMLGYARSFWGISRFLSILDGQR